MHELQQAFSLDELVCLLGVKILLSDKLNSNILNVIVDFQLISQQSCQVHHQSIHGDEVSLKLF